MKRDTAQLADTTFDAIVIGAGIHGACIARDAALRGLKVALIDKGDLGGATSHNSLKTLHGGVRYLQHLNFKRTVEGIREQLYFRSTLSNHVRPVSFLMPTFGYGMRGPVAMWIGFQLYNVLSLFTALFLRQKTPTQWASVVSSKTCKKMLNSTDESITGGALWHELQVENADGALLDIVAHAAQHNCCVASYLCADSLIFEGDHVVGVDVSDSLNDTRFSVRAKAVINATGPWVEQFLSSHNQPAHLPVAVPVSKSMNILVDRPESPLAMGLQSQYASDSVVGSTKRLFFTVPWRGRTLIGTTHSSDILDPNTLTYEQADVASFVADINQVFNLDLHTDEVLYCYQGLTPLDEPNQNNASVLHHSLVVDHKSTCGTGGLISVVGVKWTTARAVAVKCVDLLARKLDRQLPAVTLNSSVPEHVKFSVDLHSQSDDVLVNFCQVQIDQGMALRLTDLLLRRTDEFILNKLSDRQICLMARTMAEQLGWSRDTCQREHDLLLSSALPDKRKKKLDTLQWWL